MTVPQAAPLREYGNLHVRAFRCSRGTGIGQGAHGAVRRRKSSKLCHLPPDRALPGPAAIWTFHAGVGYECAVKRPRRQPLSSHPASPVRLARWIAHTVLFHSYVETLPLCRNFIVSPPSASLPLPRPGSPRANFRRSVARRERPRVAAAEPVAADKPLVRTVAAVKPAFMDYARTIRLSGITEADKRAALAARADGVINGLTLAKGGKVTAGRGRDDPGSGRGRGAGRRSPRSPWPSGTVTLSGPCACSRAATCPRSR